MGKYCTDCAKEIEKGNQDEMMAFNETVRCKECLGTAESGEGCFGGFGKMGDGGFGDFMKKKDDKPAGTA